MAARPRIPDRRRVDMLGQVLRGPAAHDDTSGRRHRNALDLAGFFPPPLRHGPDRPWVFNLVGGLRIALDLQPAARLAEFFFLAHIPRRRPIGREAEPEHVVGVVVLFVCGPSVKSATRAGVLAEFILVRRGAVREIAKAGGERTKARAGEESYALHAGEKKEEPVGRKRCTWWICTSFTSGVEPARSTPKKFTPVLSSLWTVVVMMPWHPGCERE